MSQPLRLAFRRFLLLDTDVHTAIAGARLYPNRMAQGDSGPSIVYQSIGRVTDYHMEGASGLVQMRMQVVAWSRTSDAAWALAELVRLRLSGAAGIWTYGSGATPPSVVVNSVFLDQEDEEEDLDAGLLGARRDYIITFQE